MFKLSHQKEMTTNALAQTLANTLYGRRFFPMYVRNILGGLDAEGKGTLYSYDPVGSFDREIYRACGSAGVILQSILDNQISRSNQTGLGMKIPTVDEAIALARDAFISGAERDIHCGDSLIMKIITKDETKELRFELRRD